MNTQGISFLLQIPAGAPAQNAPAAEQEISGGQAFAGLMVLLAMVGSLVMLSIWLKRFLATGNALPAANRGILRVPQLLTIITASLSGFFALMVLSGANEPPATAPPATPATPGAAPVSDTVNPQNQPPVQDPSSDSPDAPVATPTQDSSNRIPTVEERLADPTGENTESVRKAKEQAEAVQQMYSGVMNTIVLDTILLLAVGAVVWYVGKQGRVRLESGGSISAADEARMFATPSRWNDLDDVSPTINPFQSVLLSGSAAGVSEAAEQADEPFSFIDELRFAVETFLAAYLPTTVLRILIIKLIESVTGEMPGQHPFLEMLDEGVSPGLIGLIFVIAVVVAPVVEELQFRVVILGGIAQLGMPVRALILSSVLFAFAHGFPDCFALLPLAFVLGYAYLRRRSYITVMMVHFLFNLFNMALALLAMP